MVDRTAAHRRVSITLVTGPANSGKAQVVMDAVRRHLAHGAEPMLVVPTRTDAEYYLRELAGAEAAVGVRVGVFSDLVEELVRRAGIREPLLGELARDRLLGALSPAAEHRHPGFRRELGESDRRAADQARRPAAPGRRA